MMDYTELLKRAWHIVWNNKFLFVLGFLAALGSGGSSSGGNANFSFPSSSPPNFDESDFDVPFEFFENIDQYVAEIAIVVVVIIGLFIILGIIFWLIGLVGQTGMIDSTARIEAGEKATFGDAFTVGTNKIRAMAGLSLLINSPFIIFGLIIFLSLALTFGSFITALISGSVENLDNIPESFGIFFICFWVLACLMFPIGILTSIIHPFATRGLLLKGLGIVDSIRHGWQFIKNNVGEVIALIVLFVVLGFLFGIVSVIVLIPVVAAIFLPIVLPVINGAAFGVTQIVLLIIGGIVIAIIGAAINSIMITFRSTAVTLAYLQLSPSPGDKELLIR